MNDNSMLICTESCNITAYAFQILDNAIVTASGYGAAIHGVAYVSPFAGGGGINEYVLGLILGY